MTVAPIACSLSAADYRARLASIAAVGARALISVEVDRDGASGVLRFRDEPEIRAALREVVDGEAECCPFLDLRLTERGGGLELSIGGPPEAWPVVEDLLGTFDGGAVHGSTTAVER
jgi:hypothetical protein